MAKKITLDRVPPNEPDAERAVLGAMMLPDEAPNVIAKIIHTGLKFHHFYKEGHQRIYTAILNLFERGEAVDLLTVRTELERTSNLDKVGGTRYIDELIDSVPTAANVEYYAEMVLVAAERRAYIQKAVEIYQKADNKSVDIEEIRKCVEELSKIRLIDTKELPAGQLETDDEFLAADKPPTPMFIGKGLLARVGYSVVSAPTKTGKTTLAVQLCHSIVSNTDFLGFPIEFQGNIVYCFLEGDESGSQQLLRQQRENWGSTWTTNYHIFPVHCHGLQLDNATHISWLRRRILEAEAQLVVVDPLSRCISGDINKREVVARFVRKLQQIGDEMHAAWLLVHHTGKKTLVKREAIEDMLGSSEWGNSAETHIGIGRYSEHRSPEYLRLVFKLRRGRPLEDLCIYRNPTTRLFELVTNPDDIPAVSINRVVDILKEQGQPVSYTLLTELVKTNLGVNERTAKRLIAAAKESGKVVKEDGRYGKYFIF